MKNYLGKFKTEADFVEYYRRTKYFHLAFNLLLSGLIFCFFIVQPIGAISSEERYEALITHVRHVTQVKQIDKIFLTVAFERDGKPEVSIVEIPSTIAPSGLIPGQYISIAAFAGHYVWADYRLLSFNLTVGVLMAAILLYMWYCYWKGARLLRNHG